LTRRAAATLIGAGTCGWAAPITRLEAVIGSIPGTALLVDVRTGARLAVYGADLASGLAAPPGSAIKPFTIEALLAAGKLKAGEQFICPGALTIAGRSFDCSHPVLAKAVDAAAALAYSCNCFVAHFAERLAPGELAAHLSRRGFADVARATGLEGRQLQAIGEDGVMVTAAAMARAYRRLAVSAPNAIRSGLAGAVEFGTAQRARVPGVTVAGKTGSATGRNGASYAWFCGFAPSRGAAVAVAVLLAGRSGGADAAPVGAKILQAHFAGRL
jgi:cell division protein FtsI/penicillin-binding protein 2